MDDPIGPSILELSELIQKETCSLGTNMLAELPNEILLEIAKYLSAQECFSLAMTATRFFWLLQDPHLWFYQAHWDRGITADIFYWCLNSKVLAWDRYRDLCWCHATGATGSRCRRPVVSGTVYCEKHCRELHIPLCQCGPLQILVRCSTCMGRVGCGFVGAVGQCGPCGPPIESKKFRLTGKPHFKEVMTSKYKGISTSRRSGGRNHR